MTIKIIDETVAALAEYATVPIAFEVRETFARDCPAEGTCGMTFVAEPVEEPYVKNYDAVPGHYPTEWTSRFDMSRWGILVARAEGVPVGGAVVAWNTPGIDMLEGRQDLAVLWDLRVAPDYRGQGVGHDLFLYAVQWAQTRGARWLKIETQNTNASACRFYARQGCELGAINRFAYPSLPDEVQFFWYKLLV